MELLVPYECPWLFQDSSKHILRNVRLFCCFYNVQFMETVLDLKQKVACSDMQ